MRSAKVLLSLLVLASACNADSPSLDKQDQGKTRQNLLGGQPSTPEQNYALMIRRNPVGSPIGSGVLVAPNLVLTALHVVATYEQTELGDTCSEGGKGVKLFEVSKPEALQVWAGIDFPGPKTKAPVSVKKVIPHPVTDICDGDLAFLELDGDYEGIPIAPIRLDKPPLANEEALLVGWGATDTIGTAPEQRQQRDITVLSLGPGLYQKPGHIPVSMRNGQMVGTTGPCSGDSGSGLLSKESGAIIGIFNAVQPKSSAYLPTIEEPTKFCLETISLYSRLDTVRDFVINTFKSVKSAPWREGKPKPQPFGESCSEELDCLSMLCVSGRCSRPCDTEACPESYECSARQEGKVCAPLSNGQGTAGAAGAGGTQAGASGQINTRPQGTPCQGPGDCDSGLCISGGLCSARCDTAPCEGGWECTSAGGQRVCVPPAKPKQEDEGCSAAGRPGEGQTAGWCALLLLAVLRKRRL